MIKTVKIKLSHNIPPALSLVILYMYWESCLLLLVCWTCWNVCFFNLFDRMYNIFKVGLSPFILKQYEL
jgi:hypothetical protein